MLLKLKFFSASDPVKIIKRLAADWENTFANYWIGQKVCSALTEMLKNLNKHFGQPNIYPTKVLNLELPGFNSKTKETTIKQ